MIAAVKGRLVGRMGDSLLVDLGPLVLQVHTSATTIGDAGEPGGAVRLHTYLHVREDQFALYGFGTTEELALFTLLLGVTGIGPRLAANILSATRPEPLLNAISAEDVAFLSRLPGIGRKTAARPPGRRRRRATATWSRRCRRSATPPPRRTRRSRACRASRRAAWRSASSPRSSR